jgi:UDP-glucose 4-epimerase
MTKNVLVTGGAGYVGSHACKVLSQNGFMPITFDNLSTGHRQFVKWGPFFQGDLLNQFDIEEVFDQYKIESVMHFAAKAYVNESVKNPLKYYRENIQGSINLLETFIDRKGKEFVFSSSCATYGDPNVEFITEATPQNPINPYGFTKLAIEKLIVDLGKLHKFNYTILRYFNAAGADRDCEIGESHIDETHVIPLLIRAASNRESFKIFGDQFETPDGTAIRDYVHVSDLALAHLRALRRMIDQHTNVVCNLGSGRGTSVLDLVNEIKSWKSDFQVNFVEARLGDPATLIASNELSKHLLDLSYENSRIDLILQSAISWFEKDSRKLIES